MLVAVVVQQSPDTRNLNGIDDIGVSGADCLEGVRFAPAPPCGGAVTREVFSPGELLLFCKVRCPSVVIVRIETNLIVSGHHTHAEALNATIDHFHTVRGVPPDVVGSGTIVFHESPKISLILDMLAFDIRLERLRALLSQAFPDREIKIYGAQKGD